MATKFAKGQVVTIDVVVPKGPVAALRMDENGDFFYQMSWVDAEGVTQQRWFSEAELVAA